MSFYGSSHTHIESDKDTANDIKKAVSRFHELGCKKLAITEHGCMSSYEDLKTAVSKQGIKDMDIIPGCEIYFEYNGIKNNHMVLIAKDEIGYKQLCNIVTEAYKNSYIQNKMVIPVTTLENLKNNVEKGHLICNSACIGGPYGHLFGLDYFKEKKKANHYKSILEKRNYFEYKKDIDAFNQYDAEIMELYPTPEEIEEINGLKLINRNYRQEISSITQEIKDIRAEKKIAKQEKDTEKISKLEDKEFSLNAQKADYQEKIKSNSEIIKRSDEKKSWVNAQKKEEKYLELKAKLKNAETYIKQNKLSRIATEYEKHYQRELELKEERDSKENIRKAKELTNELINIFGKENFYFELQNHGLDEEKAIYNSLVKFAFMYGHAHFIATNDIHIAKTKDDKDFDNAVLNRNIIQFTRNTVYRDLSSDAKEYGIKTDEELEEELLKIIPDIKNKNGDIVVSKEAIIKNSISNIKQQLSQCNVNLEYRDHYPLFGNSREEDDALFEKLVTDGAKIRFPDGYPSKEYEERLQKELHIIKTMGYSSYHLIVQDYLEYGRLLGYLPEDEIDNAPLSIDELRNYIDEKGYDKLGFGVGTGRGSAAGSLCCYNMGITDIDPIKYDLLFERFLNPERKSMPKQYWAFAVNSITQRCGRSLQASF